MQIKKSTNFPFLYIKLLYYRPFKRIRIYWHGICGVHYLTNVTVVNEGKIKAFIGRLCQPLYLL